MTTLMRWLVYTLGLAVVVMAGALVYQYVASTAILHDIDAQRAALELTQRTSAEAAKAQAMRRQLIASITPRGKEWSWSEQLPVMVTQIAGIANGCGAVIDTFQPSPVVASQQLTRFPLHLTLHMHLATLTTFLRQAQQATPLLAIDQLTIHVGKLPGDPLLVGVTFSSYVMPDEGPSVAPTAPGKPVGGQL